MTKLHVGPYENNAYLLRDPETNDALLVDAANEAERLLDELLQGVSLVGIVTTHRHPDHIQALAGVLKVHDVWNGAHPADADAIADQVGVTPDRMLEHGDTLTVGRYAVTVLFTPGHTEGSISFKLPSSQVLTGDALFPGGVGKTEGRTPSPRRSARPSSTCCRCPARPASPPGTATTPWSSGRSRSSTSGRRGAGDRDPPRLAGRRRRPRPGHARPGRLRGRPAGPGDRPGGRQGGRLRWPGRRADRDQLERRAAGPAEAEQAAQKLDQRLREVNDADVKQAGEALRDRVRELADAARNASAADVQQALADVEAAARRLASTCGVDAGEVGGG